MAGAAATGRLKRGGLGACVLACLGLTLCLGVASGSASLARETEQPRPAASRSGTKARIAALNAQLLAGGSATLVLDAWCSRNGMAPAGSVKAEKLAGGRAMSTRALRRRLGIGRGEPIGYRRVRLHCGPHILSEADNYYVPARLTAAMNAALDGSDAAFGRVAAPLRYQRRTVSARLFRARSSARGSRPPADLFVHRALLTLPDGRPLAYVRETYKSGALEFGDN